MRPLNLNTYDISGGAARAAFRLHKGLQKLDVDSRMLVQFKDGDDYKVICPSSKWAKGFSLFRPVLDGLPIKFYRNREHVIFSPAILPHRLSARVASSYDLVHLHWINGGFLHIKSLRKFNKPIVWTLHDMWPFTGGCHYDNGCGKYKEACGACPQLGSKRVYDLSRWIWKRKRRAWENINITVVAPSQWLGECAMASSLFRKNRIKVIPNGLCTDCYKPVDKELARERWSLSLGKRLILFGAMDPSGDGRKGFQFLQSSLKELVKNGLGETVELIIFGASMPSNPPDFGLKAHYVGKLYDDVSLALLYAAADVFVLPSVQDNLPNTIMESLACGTPVVAFNIGGISDMVEHRVNGYLAKKMNIDDLANGIRWVLEDAERSIRLSKGAREKAVKEYSSEAQARRYRDLYEEILKDH